MKRLKLLVKYSKIFGKSKYIILFQYLLSFLFIITFIPYLRNSYENLKLVRNDPFNKLVYFQNVQPIESNGLDIVNRYRLVNNDEKLLKIMKKYPQINTYSSLVKSGWVIDNDIGYDYTCIILDELAFRKLFNVNEKLEENKYYGAVYDNKYTNNKFEIGKKYSLKFVFNEKAKKFDVSIIKAINDNHKIIYPSILTNDKVSMDDLFLDINVKQGNLFILMDNEKLKSELNEKDKGITSFQRVIYFKNGTEQYIIDKFVNEIKSEHIGYINSNLDIQDAQKEVLSGLIERKLDRAIIFTILLLFMLFIVLKISHKKIYDFNKLMITLGLKKRNAYILNFVYNSFLFLFSMLIIILYNSYNNDGFLASLLSNYATGSKFGLLQHYEFLYIFLFFTIVNFLLTVYMYVLDRGYKEGN